MSICDDELRRESSVRAETASLVVASTEPQAAPQHSVGIRAFPIALTCTEGTLRRPPKLPRKARFAALLPWS